MKKKALPFGLQAQFLIFLSAVERFAWGIQNIIYLLFVINLILSPAATLGA